LSNSYCLPGRAGGFPGGDKVIEGNKPDLRARAETAVLKNPAVVPKGLSPSPQADVQKLIHKLQVHQVELEMQNEELSRARTNLTAVNMLDLALSTLVRKPITHFIFKEDQDIYYLHLKQLYQMNRSAACELRMVKKDGTPFWVQLTSTPPDAAQDAGSTAVCRVVLSDITEKKMLQEENSNLRAQFQPPKRGPKKNAGKS
jgi:hypothetical protein